MTFEEYLITKKINEKAFQQAEPRLYESWKMEFEQISPSSFTAQKLYLINPIRRKYILKEDLQKVKEVKASAIANEEKTSEDSDASSGTIAKNESIEENKNTEDQKTIAQSLKSARPVFKPKPKIN